MWSTKFTKPELCSFPEIQNALLNGLCRSFAGNEMMHFGGQSAVKLGTTPAFLIVWVDLNNEQGYYVLSPHCVSGFFVVDEAKQSALQARIAEAMRNHTALPSGDQHTGGLCK